MINSAIDPIIIIQGDHGTCSTCGSSNVNNVGKNEIKEEILRERMNILNVMYLPSGGSELLYN